MELTKADLLAIYRWMVLTRTVEERICDLMKERVVPEGQHASTGQEAIGVGMAYGLRPGDVVSPTLRNRAARLVRGITTKETMAALLGKATGGIAKGKHVSRHMGDLKLGIIPCTASIGSILSVATGAGYACKLNRQGQVVVAFFGDGASNAGVFHESLNWASVFKLPVIYVCENNQYAISTHVSHSMAVPNVADRAAGYGIPGKVVDGNDVLAVYSAAEEAIQRARDGGGPSLLECKTYRWRAHNEPDVARQWRIPGDDYDAWLERCPIKRLKQHLLNQGLADEAELAGIDSQVTEEVEDAVNFAVESPYPPLEEMFADIYAPNEIAAAGEAQR